MIRRGGCLCGGVRYELTGDPAEPVACHCSQCARTSGNYAAMAAWPASKLVLAASETLAWFRSSDAASRGFCSCCGGNLFWRAEPRDGEIYVTLGTLDQPTGLKLAGHIFAASKGDHYEITDGLPQKPEW
jgi:hypothetical protein